MPDDQELRESKSLVLSDEDLSRVENICLERYGSADQNRTISRAVSKFVNKKECNAAWLVAFGKLHVSSSSRDPDETILFASFGDDKLAVIMENVIRGRVAPSGDLQSLNVATHRTNDFSGDPDRIIGEDRIKIITNIFKRHRLAADVRICATVTQILRDNCEAHRWLIVSGRNFFISAERSLQNQSIVYFAEYAASKITVIRSD